jgi:hypothetical protein
VTDLYVSYKNGDGSWTAPANLGPTINTAAKEAFPFVTFDGKYLFFMSNRMSALNRSLIPDGPGNVYWVDARVIRALAPARQSTRTVGRLTRSAGTRPGQCFSGYRTTWT